MKRRNRRRLGILATFVVLGALVGFRGHAPVLDWEVVILLAIACAGVFVMWEYRQAHLQDHAERLEQNLVIARLEHAVSLCAHVDRVDALERANADAVSAERVAMIETAIGLNCRDRSIDARTSALEGWTEALDDRLELASRVAAIESRLDHRAVTPTRPKVKTKRKKAST